MEDRSGSHELVELTADVVSAYVSNNTVVAGDLPAVINETFEALSKASMKASQPVKEELNPSVPIKKSVTPDYIIVWRTERNSNR